jgi:twinkle protein
MELTHQKCPYVECESWGTPFSYNTILKVGKCHSCGRGYPSKDVMHDWAKEEYPTNGKHDEDEYEVVDYTPKDIGPWEYVPYRGITTKTMEYFGVRTYNDRQEYIYPSGGVKVRKFPKDFTTHSGFKSDELFGMNLWNAGSQKVLTIVEGELDALSAFQMLQNGQWVNPVVSLPSATPSKRLWENCKDWINSYEKIVVSTDNDDAGDRIASVISEVFPGKVYRVQHSKYKDANEFLQADAAKEYKSAWFNAQRMKPDNILATDQDFQNLYDNTPDYQYCPTNIPDLDDKILGLHKGAFTVIVAPTGLGKTEFMRYLEHQVLTTSEYSIAVCHLEETGLRSVLGLVSYRLEDNLTRKDLVEDKNKEQEVKASIKELADTERFYQFYLGTDESHEDLVDRIRYLVAAMGVDFVFFEPIQDVVSGNTSDKESKLSDLSNTLSRLAPEINVGIVAIAHANEDGDTKYCKTIAQKAAFEITLHRDMESEDTVERNRTYVKVGRKNRVGGGSGPAGVMEFDKETYMLKPVYATPPETPNRKGLDF